MKKQGNSSGRFPHKKTIEQNIVFDSKMESEYFLKCQQEVREGEILKFERQVEFVLQEKFEIVNGKKYYEKDFSSKYKFDKFRKDNNGTLCLPIKYIADFVKYYKDGRVVVVDTKGKSSTDFEIKRKLFMFQHPEMEFQVLTLYKGQWQDYYEVNKIKNANKRLRKAKKAAKDKKVE